MLDTLLQHRTIRKYTTSDISDQQLSKILEAGCRASTTGNMQVYSIVVNRDPKMKELLSGCHFNQPMVKNAPVVLTFCADFNRFNLWCKRSHADPGYDNFLSFFTAAIDALLVAQNVCVAAESEGLGICYLGTTTYLAGKIIDILHLPKGVVPVTTVTLGWPDEEPALTDRLPLEAIVHKETYQDYNDDDIARLYSVKEQLAENRRFVAENSKQSLAQVFTDIRYKKSDNELFSNMLLEVLIQQGFMN
ncbi:MAG: NADPH-dependent oxidoreductase [Prolixibacteraceae bacterium]|jgi:nitroreductase|nr:NADPH-dependent oxidoreductase [Prolixibacteraceae bacterium]